MRFLFAAFMAVFVYACATAQSPPVVPACQADQYSRAEWVAEVKGAAPNVMIVELSDQARDVFITNFNRANPPTDYKPTNVFVVMVPHGRLVAIAFVYGDCYSRGAFSMTVETFELLLGLPSSRGASI